MIISSDVVYWLSATLKSEQLRHFRRRIQTKSGKIPVSLIIVIVSVFTCCLGLELQLTIITKTVLKYWMRTRLTQFPCVFLTAGSATKPICVIKLSIFQMQPFRLQAFWVFLNLNVILNARIIGIRFMFALLSTP